MENKEQNSDAIKIVQESLQPQRIRKDEKAYRSVNDIVERLREGDATNISLTGPYGSGKSSVLKTLKDDFPEYDYLNISLATLQSLKNEGNRPKTGGRDDKVSKQNLDRLIEYSILQQLIYREKQETLPNSRLKRIFHLSRRRVHGISFFSLLAVLAFVIVFEPAFLRVEWLCRLLGYQWLNIAGDIVCIAYLVWFAFKALSMLIPALSNSRLNKLNLKSGEIEIVKNTSIFNKHLDEILYFFEMTNYNVVILEDLDRFNSTDIFLKLRELNLLLNESHVIDRKIFFIYAVRDDMFKNEERVKCFDYITTVIPVINPSNAKNVLKSELEKRGVTEISEAAFRDLGFFLRDMRLLKNIANEFVQYRGRLENGISSEKLLAMIVYKNYYPQDFAELHDCDGTLYKLLNMKATFIEDRVKAIEEDNEKKMALQIAHIKERHLREVELRRLYVDAYRDLLSASTQRIKADDNYYSFNDIANNEKLFDKLISSSRVYFQYIYYNQYQQDSKVIPFNDIEKAVNPDATYQERLMALRSAFEDLNASNPIEIRKEDIRSQSLSQIMKEIDYARYPDYVALKVPPLIEFLVLNGYIDENYYDYISYFYDNFVDKHDWSFVLDLKLGKSHPYDYTVHQVEACLREIPASTYRAVSVLNIDIVDYLASNSEENKNVLRLKTILRTVVANHKYDFLVEYFRKGKKKDEVFATLFSQSKTLWPDVDKYDDTQNQLRLIWFKYAEKGLSCKDSRNWLSKHYGFITDHLLDISENEWCEMILKNEYRFDDLDNKSSEVLKTVADRNAYVLSKNNVEVLVSCLLEIDCDSLSYQMVRSTEHKQLIDCVEEDLGQCIKSVFSEPESNKETEMAILGILSSEKVKEEDKINYLSKQQNKIDLAVVDSGELKSLALKSNVVKPTWENVAHYMKYFGERKSDEKLVTFIEHNIDAFSVASPPRSTEEDGDERMLLREFIMTDLLSFDSYQKVIEQFSRWQMKAIPSIEEQRIQLMIDKGMVPFKKENTTGLLSLFSGETVVSYLMKNKRDFLDAIETVEYTTEVALGLLRAGLSRAEKASIVPLFKEEILNEDLANEIMILLNIQEVTLDYQFLLRAMNLSSKTTEKINVLNNTLETIKNVDDSMITDLLRTLPSPYFNISVRGKKPVIQKNAGVIKLVRILKDKDYISSYSVKENEIRVNTKLRQ